jgi:hypothetical protein
MNQPSQPIPGNQTVKESDIDVSRGGDRLRRQTRLERNVPLTIQSGGGGGDGRDIADSATFPPWDQVLDWDKPQGDWLRYR